VCASSECLDVERLGIVPVDSITDSAKPCELGEALRSHDLVGHQALASHVCSFANCIATCLARALRLGEPPGIACGSRWAIASLPDPALIESAARELSIMLLRRPMSAKAEMSLRNCGGDLGPHRCVLGEALELGAYFSGGIDALADVVADDHRERGEMRVSSWLRRAPRCSTGGGLLAAHEIAPPERPVWYVLDIVESDLSGPRHHYVRALEAGARRSRYSPGSPSLEILVHLHHREARAPNSSSGIRKVLVRVEPAASAAIWREVADVPSDGMPSTVGAITVSST
jgi:hypothetical protein